MEFKPVGNLGRNIKTYRAKRGLTQAECASYATVTQQMWAAWENNARVPSVKMLFFMAQLLDCTMEQLCE